MSTETSTTSKRSARLMPRAHGGFGSAQVRSLSAVELIRAGALKPGRIVSNYGGRHVEATLLPDGHVLLPGSDRALSLSGAASLLGAGNVSGYEFWKGSDGARFLSIETIRRHHLHGQPRRGSGLGLVPRELDPELRTSLRARLAAGESARELAALYGLRQYDVNHA